MAKNQKIQKKYKIRGILNFLKFQIKTFFSKISKIGKESKKYKKLKNLTFTNSKKTKESII